MVVPTESRSRNSESTFLLIPYPYCRNQRWKFCGQQQVTLNFSIWKYWLQREIWQLRMVICTVKFNLLNLQNFISPFQMNSASVLCSSHKKQWRFVIVLSTFRCLQEKQLALDWWVQGLLLKVSHAVGLRLELGPSSERHYLQSEYERECKSGSK